MTTSSFSPSHLRRVVHTYVAYYNGARPSQAIHAIPAPYPELRTAIPPRARSSPCPSSAASITTTGSQRSVPTIPAKVHRQPDRWARRPLIGSRPGDLTPENPGRRWAPQPPGPSPLHRLHESPIAMSSRGLRPPRDPRLRHARRRDLLVSRLLVSRRRLRQEHLDRRRARLRGDRHRLGLPAIVERSRPMESTTRRTDGAVQGFDP